MVTHQPQSGNIKQPSRGRRSPGVSPAVAGASRSCAEQVLASCGEGRMETECAVDAGTGRTPVPRARETSRPRADPNPSIACAWATRKCRARRRLAPTNSTRVKPDGAPGPKACASNSLACRYRQIRGATVDLVHFLLFVIYLESSGCAFRLAGAGRRAGILPQHRPPQHSRGQRQLQAPARQASRHE